MIGGPAFAGEPGSGGPGHHRPHGDVLIEEHAGPQVGLVNLQGIDVAKDINAAVNAGVCGTQALAIPVLSPVGVGNCASGGIDD
nr:hypothetical protein [Kibdelosporangium phytohabitans]